MIQQNPVMRLCISCRKTYDRNNLFKITKDHKQGIIFRKGIGRSAYICHSKKCHKICLDISHANRLRKLI